MREDARSMVNVKLILLIPDFIEEGGGENAKTWSGGDSNNLHVSLCAGGNAPKTGECNPEPSSLDCGPSSESMWCGKGE